MPMKRNPSEKELERLRRIFLQAETDIINEIGRLRSKGLVDYHAAAALERVQAILKEMERECWEYVPQMVEKQFYVNVPEARKMPEPVEKHRKGYANAEALTAQQYSIIDHLVMNLMGEISEASKTVLDGLERILIGRREEDTYRRAGLEQTAARLATGRSVSKGLPAFVTALRREGITAFVDKAGRHWSLHTYCTMVSRTTSRQAEVLSVLTADPEHDLYQISSHGTTCKICAPLEGRVYSRSGRDPDFPPLSAAFGKIDPNGSDDLANTYLNIHPNCLHVLQPWTAAGRSEKELEEIKKKSSFQENPPRIDPRTQKQIAAYRRKEQGRAKWLADYRQWEKYRMELGDSVPKTFQTFQKHKLAGDEKYKRWQEDYKKRFYLQSRLDYTIGNEEAFIPDGAVFETVRTIAGKGSKIVFRHAQDYAGLYGGKVEDWSKKVGKIESAKYTFDVHWVEKDGTQYDAKVKYRKEK